ncbi:MAG: hypothetical protein ACAH59_09125 [Pseudobdellovibrionaceae bacterium]
MKTFILALSLFLTLAARAEVETENIEFQVEKASFAEAHVAHPGNARLFINYAENNVTLKVDQLFHCDSGEVCAQVMPVPKVITLPIVSIEEVSCGIRKVTAQVDARPADGLLQTLVAEDSSDMTCQTLLRYQAKATYETKVYDRLQSTEVHNVSKMVISPLNLTQVSQNLESFHFTQGFFEAGFPAIEKPISGSLFLSDTVVKLDVKVGLNCGSGQPCPRYLPRPIMTSLPVVKVDRSSCGDKIMASSAALSSVEGVTEEIEVMDYRSSSCKMVIPHLMTVTYRLKAIDRNIERRAVLHFDR